MDKVDKIIAYECGDLSAQGTLELFSDLVASGEAYQLQGHYGRTAHALINAGYIDAQGKILKNIE